MEDNTVEDWKGMGQAIKDKNKSTYIEKDPTILYYNESSQKSSAIGVLKNGSFAELRSINIANTLFTVINTCAFDSFIQIWLCAYFDSKKYAEYMEKNSNNLFMEMVSNALHDGVNAQTYRKRALILKDVIDEKSFIYQPDGSIVLDSACTAQHIIKHIFSIFAFVIAKLKCSDCHETYSTEESSILANLPTDDFYHN